MMKKVLAFLMLALLPTTLMAQTAGGQITRKQTSTTTQPNNTNKQNQSTQNRLAQQKRAAQLQAERERKERLEQERAERERIAQAQAERERQEQEAREQAAKEAERTRILQNLINKMVYVAGGTFVMGDKSSDAYDSEKPTHKVTLSSFSIGRYEVTQEEWHVVMGSNPSNFKGANRPVENVSWDDCQEFICKLNAMTGKRFRLPTEAEWEYAARGGNKTNRYKYSGSNDSNSVAWYNLNSGCETHEVGSRQPNELGLYDMSGNVWEWCLDWYGNYSSSAQTNPIGQSSGSIRVIRGGGWNCDSLGCRVSYRNYTRPSNHGLNLGLRLAL